MGFPFIKHLCSQIPPILGAGRREIREGFLEEVGLRTWEKRAQGKGTWHVHTVVHGGMWGWRREVAGQGGPESPTADC